MKRTLLSALGLLILVALPGFFAANSASAAAIKSLAGCTANTLPANDDGSTGEVALPFTLDFFGAMYSSIYVNNNGNVTFEAPMLTFTPFNLLTTETVIIAPFFGDVDTQGDGSGVVTYGAATFGGRTAFCANWINVGYFSSRTDKLNSFQLLLVDRSDVGAGDFDIIMNYDRIQWETGNASGGIDGLGGSSARVGYSNGVDTAFELPGSATNGAFLDSSPGGLIHDSRDSLINGRYVFPVRSGVAPTGGTISGTVYGDEEGSAGGPAGSVALAGAFVQACPLPGTCSTTTTNALGEYMFTGLGGGVNFFVTAFPPGSSLLGPRQIGALFLPVGGTLTGQDILLIPSVSAPPNVTVGTPFTAGDGTPAILSDRSSTVTQTDSPSGGVATWSLIQGGVVIDSGPMVEAPPGTYTATIPAQGISRTGRADMKISIDYPETTSDKQTVFDIYIDPSGTVRTTDGNPIAGATVTLWRSDSSSGPFEQVPDGSGIMSPSNRTNPDTTGPDGVFRWDVIAGYYVVRAQAPGCVSPFDPSQAYVDTGAMEIPPPVTDLDIRLSCGGEPVPSPTPLPPVGDANCNGSVDSIDAALVLQYGAGLVASLPCQVFADVNEDSTVNSIDAALILQFNAGLIPSLPV